MSLIVTPPINSTETFQVATPFSYSFTYPTVVQTVDSPVYYFGGSLFSGGSNSTVIKCYSAQNPVSGYGLTYTVSNMTATTDVLECVLPIPAEFYKLNAGSYVTFGGPFPIYLESSLADPSNSIPARYTATIASFGPFQYGLNSSIRDSIQYIPLVGSPVSSFKIVLKRPEISNASVFGNITDNILLVQEFYGGQLTVGMVFPVQGTLTVACTVTAYGSGLGGVGTYTLTRNSGSGPVNMDADTLNTSVIANTGNVVLSNSMTPPSGTAKFEIYTDFTYVPRIEA